MQRSILASFSVFIAFLFLASPVLAHDPSVFKSKMLCDTDGQIETPFTDVTGSAAIFDNGDLTVTIRKLKPSTEYTCRIICNNGLEQASCSTNAFGKLDVLLPGLGRSGSLVNGCGQPIVTAFTTTSGTDNHPNPGDLTDFCQTGYGLDVF